MTEVLEKELKKELKKDELSPFMIDAISRMINAIRPVKMINELANILYKFEKRTDDYTIDDYLKEIETGIYKVLEHYHFPKTEAETHIEKLLKNKNFKQQLLDTGAYDKEKKNHDKYNNLYLPVYQIFCQYIWNYLKSFNKRPQDKIYYYMAHFLVGSEVEMPPVKSAYDRIKKAINRFEKDNPTHKRLRKKFETPKLETLLFP
jgi:hypothetical protein